MLGPGSAPALQEARVQVHRQRQLAAILPALLFAAFATLVARAQDFSSYTGPQLYKRFCASCHGPTAHGDGGAAASFKIMVPDLTRIAKRHGGEFPEDQVRKIIDGRTVIPPHGSREMPVWGYEFYSQNAGLPDAGPRTDALIARLTEYLKSLQRE
jgi:mono/diheme cytochrome c family protein